MSTVRGVPSASVIPDASIRAGSRRRKPSGWAAFALRRAQRLVVSLLVLVTATFFMIHLIPGDPIRAALGASAPQELVDARRTLLGLDQPIWIQFGDSIRGLLVGDLGSSIATGKPVALIIEDKIPATLEIAGAAFVTTVLLAVPIGVIAAWLTRNGRRRHLELTFTTTSSILAAIPEFLLTVGLVAGLGVALGVVPVAGRSGPDSYIIPAVALSLGPAAFLGRLLRIEILNVLRSDYIRTARTKRLGTFQVLLRHALPNAATTTLTVGGLILGGLIAGTVLVENVLSWPGLGSTMVSSILTKDYPVVQGIVLTYGVLILLINLVIDIILALLDPRSAIREA